MVKIRSLYGVQAEERLPGTVNEEPSRTQQHFKDECDVNYIMRKYQATGVLVDPSLQKRKPSYADLTTIPDYVEAQQAMIKAGEMFNALPSKIRKEFHNDAYRFVDFCSNPENRDKLIELGIIEKPPYVPPKPEPVPEGEEPK